MLAIGILAARVSHLLVPASAQGVWIGAGPVGVGVGPNYGYYNGYYDYGPVIQLRLRRRLHLPRHCRVVRENFNGYVRKVRLLLECYCIVSACMVSIGWNTPAAPEASASGAFCLSSRRVYSPANVVSAHVNLTL